MKNYRLLLESARDLAVLQSAGSVLSWDMETKMPPAGVELKSQQLSFLKKMEHRMLTDPENEKLLDIIEGHRDYDDLDAVQKRNVYLARKAYEEASALPEELVTDIAKQRTIGVNVWKKAKAKRDWDLFEPELKKIKDLQEEAYNLLMDVKEAETVYDAMIDDYEPKMTAATITDVFEDMRGGLQKLIDRIMAEEEPDTSFLSRHIPESVQEKIAESLADYILYDITSEEASGRIDTTEHPFTTGYYTDVRITTNFHEDFFPASLFSILHEGGHALYGLGLPKKWMYQPVGDSSSNGIHESMSRFIENHVGRSQEFWEYYMPILKGLTWDTLKDISAEDMFKAVNHVTPSKIRIEADEVTYGLHIVIRFEIERDMFRGDIDVGELPQVWNQKYDDYLGVEVENDGEGVMQDTHWAGGAFGYFPSYALGNIYDGLWREKIEDDIPKWREKIRMGEFKPIKEWLTENVYNYGNLYDPEDLVKHVTGESLKVKPFLAYLERKFSLIYGL
ncbi:MAG: carboxypeptidase M32 [Candidatus Bathyarchaeia archaeon]